LLYDIFQACELLKRFTAGKSATDYEDDPLLRSAVERQFEIIGEAISQALKFAPELSNLISETPKIVAFRNILIHGYSSLDHKVVWDILQKDLPLLHQEVSSLLGPLQTH